MAVIMKACDQVQAFNLERDTQATIGHLTFLKVSDKDALKADISVKKPLAGNEAASVVGVINEIEWEGGYAKPIRINCQVSTQNKQTVSMLLHQDLANTGVVMKFNIYEYDPHAKVHYLCFHTLDANVEGLLLKEGGKLSLTIENNPSEDVPSPQNYTMEFTVMPKEAEQALQFATSSTQKTAKYWGVTVA